jgi:hypothetical protein
MTEPSDSVSPDLPPEGQPPHAAPPVTVWRPPLTLKVIAVIEAVGGLVLAELMLESIAHGAKLAWPIQILFETVIVAAILAGVTLWKGEPPGFFASCILQVLQIVRVVSRPISFALLLGPSVTLSEPAVGSPTIQLELRATLTMWFGRIPEGTHAGFAINFVPIVVLILLLRFQALSGQPWLRPRERRVSWDRAQWIGAYQIAAGALGIVNSMPRPPHAMANMLFSIVVIASGVALVRRVRWSDGFGVAVNAIQIPAVGATQLTYLVRSGVSCVTALAWGASGGLRFQFDVGSVINSDLAPGVDGFVGINVTALALALLLIHYRPDEPAPSRLEGRFFLTPRR